MGIKDNYATYISQTKVNTPTSKYPHGYCAILSLSAVMEWPKEKINELTIETVGDGVAFSNSTETVFMPGRFVKLSAEANDGATFLGWTGDLTSNDTEIFIEMDAAKTVTANFSAGVGIHEVRQNDNWNIYPNPVKEILHIKNNASTSTYQILTLNGTILQSGNTEALTENAVSVSHLTKGVYLLEIGNTTKSFVKE